jgi:hypothetical protein
MRVLVNCHINGTIFVTLSVTAGVRLGGSDHQLLATLLQVDGPRSRGTDRRGPAQLSSNLGGFKGGQASCRCLQMCSKIAAADDSFAARPSKEVHEVGSVE